MRTIDVAIAQLGVKEATGHNDGDPFTRYMHSGGAARGKVGDAWCAHFVIWCNEQSTDAHVCLSDKERWLFPEVRAMEAGLKARGLWLPPETVPQRNDIIFFGTRGASDSGKGRHVGIVESTSGADNQLIHTVEGNVGDKVARLVHDMTNPATRGRVTGFARLP